MKRLKSIDNMSRIAVEKVPELQPYFDYIYEGEEADYSLAYSFFSNSLAMMVRKLYVGAYEEYRSRERKLLDRILDLIEEFASNENEDVVGVIQLGILHGFSYFGADYEPIKKLLRPKTYELLMADEEAYGVPPLVGATKRRDYRELDDIIEQALQIQDDK